MKSSRLRTVFIALVCFGMISCSFTQKLMYSIAGPQAPVDMLTQVANPVRPTDQCNATQHVQVSGHMTRNQTDAWGTWLCEYHLALTNAHPDRVLWVLAHKHEADVWAKTDESEWMLIGRLDPQGTEERPAYVDEYTDPDATGWTFLIFDKVAAVYDLPECLSLRSDTGELDYIATTVTHYCKRE